MIICGAGGGVGEEMDSKASATTFPILVTDFLVTLPAYIKEAMECSKIPLAYLLTGLACC